MKSFRIEEADDGIRLDRWVKRHVPQLSQGKLQQALRKGMVKLEGKKTEAAVRLEAGQNLSFAPVLLQQGAEQPARAPLSEQQVREMRSAVLYEDAHCLVLNKPAGLAVQGGSKVRDSVDARLDALAGKGGERPKLVHRLDRDTSGVLLLAKSARDATRLTQAFAGKDVQKTYWALVVGVPEVREGKINLPLAKQLHGGEEKMAVDRERGKSAVTFYRVLDTLGDLLAWVELMPVTGRTHQLRAHMAAIGHPILGDGKYGGAAAFVPSLELPAQLHLHARRLVLEEMGLDATAPLPKHFRQSFKALGFSAEEA